MKQAMNFRLNHHATTILTALEQKMHTSKTAIVEKALQLYAKKELSEQALLLEYAGILSDEEATSMLTAIESSRHNKKIETEL